MTGIQQFFTQWEPPTAFDRTIEINPISNYHNLKAFHKVPFIIYQDDPYWVAPLWKELKEFFHQKNPYWNHAEAALFIAYQNKKTIGRIAAFVDYLYCKTTKTQTGFFGYYESINNLTCAKALLETAKHWLASKKMSRMLGPLNGRIDNGCGFQYSGFNTTPCLLSSYSPPYYISLAKHYNMKKTRDQIVYYIDLTNPLPSALRKKAKKCEQSGITIRPFNRFRTKKEFHWWIDFFLETFQDHWGYIPVSKDEIKTRFGVKQLRWIVDSDLFLIAEYEDRPLGYIWASPDYNQLFKQTNGKHAIKQYFNVFVKKHQIKRGVLHFISVKKGIRQKDIGSFLNYHVLHTMQQKGYTCAEVGWIDEFNTQAHETIKYTGARIHKKFRVFEKPIYPQNQFGGAQ